MGIKSAKKGYFGICSSRDFLASELFQKASLWKPFEEKGDSLFGPFS